MESVQASIALPEAAPERAGFDGDVWIGDVVHAWRALGATSRVERAVIAGLLGFHLHEEVEPAPPPSAPEAPASERPLSRQGLRTSAGDSDPVPTRTPSTGPIVVPLGPLVEAEGSAPGDQPRWRLEAVPLAPERPQHLAFAPVPEPLFDARWTRAIVGAICATRSQDGPIDMEALVERIARSEAIAELPRERVVTVRRGVQLLIDHGQSMMPFMRDVEQITERIVEVTGVDRTQVWRFSGFPEDGAGPGGPSTWQRPYPPPPAGTPVVVISDLGAARGAAARDGASRDAWLTFGAKLTRSGCPAIALVPLPAERLATLSAGFRILSWDRSTAVSQARRAAAGEV